MTFEERLKTALNTLGIVKEGSLFSVHYKLLNFGNENKKNHFALNIDQYSNKYDNFRTHPLTSQPTNDKRIYQLDLETDSTVQLEEHQKKKSNVLLFLIRKIEYKDLTKSEFISHKGEILPSIYVDIKRAKRKLIHNYLGRK
jgi:ribosomal protein S18